MGKRVGRIKHSVEEWAVALRGGKAVVPEELRHLPTWATEIDRPLAEPTCRGRSHHRFQHEPNGFQCAVCGGWKEE
jgi:hypothetical protein